MASMGRERWGASPVPVGAQPAGGDPLDPRVVPALVGCPRGYSGGSWCCCLPAGQLPPHALRANQRLRLRCRNFFGRRLIV